MRSASPAASPGIITNDRHVDARIIEVRPFRVQDELARGRIVVIAGYQGVSYRREVTTLGRGGSDTTAVAMAAALGAEYCEICSDVDGVYTADPRVVPAARRIGTLSYEETQELAESGAKVLNAQAVEFAKEQGIAIYARATASALPGRGSVCGRHRRPAARAANAGHRWPASRASATCSCCSRPRTATRSSDCSTQRASRASSCTRQRSAWVRRVDHDRVARKPARRRAVARGARAPLRTDRVPGRRLGAVSVVGAGINASFANVRRGSACLRERDITIAGIATSSFRITWLIARDRLDRGVVRLLHADISGRQRASGSVTETRLSALRSAAVRRPRVPRPAA